MRLSDKPAAYERFFYILHMISYAKPSTEPNRRSNQNPIDRREYLQRAGEFSIRGDAHYSSKLTEKDVIDIRSAVKQRNSLLQYIRDNLSNDALTQKFGISENSLTKVVQGKTYGGVA